MTKINTKIFTSIIFDRKDLLAANVKIFKVQGEALEKFAKKSVKVLVVGNPANTNALICSHFAPSIPKYTQLKNISYCHKNIQDQFLRYDPP